IAHKVVPKNSYKKNVRTLIMSSKSGDTTKVSFDFLSDIKHAIVIDLSHMGIDNVPDSICEVNRLRLLNLSGNPFLKLPNLFGQLTGLETLKLENCDRLKQWPKDMKNVVTLRHLLISVWLLENLPLEFSKFVNLEMLYVFIVGKSNKSYGTEHLKDQDMLRGSICMVNLENVRSHDAMEASLHMKPFLDEVEFVWNAAFPDWLNTLPKLSVIHLMGCTKNSVLNDLGILQHLESLVIEDMHMLDIVSSRFSGLLCMESLKILKTKKMTTWGMFVVSDDRRFPNLLIHEINNCHMLKELPMLTGKKLECLTILQCPNILSSP
ncbi:hypothetical protein MIMGU_mgv1a020974mg, partial [Erythranthe guttata]